MMVVNIGDVLSQHHGLMRWLLLPNEDSQYVLHMYMARLIEDLARWSESQA